MQNGNIIYDGSLQEIKYKFGNIKTIEIKTNEKYDINNLNTFNKLVEYKATDTGLIIQFDADKIELEDVIDELEPYSLIDLRVRLFSFFLKNPNLQTGGNLEKKMI